MGRRGASRRPWPGSQAWAQPGAPLDRFCAHRGLARSLSAQLGSCPAFTEERPFDLRPAAVQFRWFAEMLNADHGARAIHDQLVSPAVGVRSHFTPNFLDAPPEEIEHRPKLSDSRVSRISDKATRLAHNFTDRRKKAWRAVGDVRRPDNEHLSKHGVVLAPGYDVGRQWTDYVRV